MTGIDEWRGRVGEIWALNGAMTDQLLAPFGAAGIAALGPVSGLRGLDIGCGAGASTQYLTQLGAQMTGLDVSGDLIAQARARPSAETIEFVNADAARWSTQVPIDFAFSRFGTMFFDDPPAALAHLRAQARQDAPLVAVAWAARDLNPWASLPQSVLGAFMTPTENSAPQETAPSPQAPGPFGWSDADYAVDLLRNAGWRNVTATKHEAKPIIGLPGGGIEAAVTFFTRIGPGASMMKAQPGPVVAQMKAKLGEALADHLVGNDLRLRATAWIYTAQA